MSQFRHLRRFRSSPHQSPTATCTPPPLPHHPHRLRSLSSAAAARCSPAAATWTPAPLVHVSPATADSSLFHVSLYSPALAAAHVSPGQYIQIRPADCNSKPIFLAIASPPFRSSGVVDFLIKRVARGTSEAVCRLREGDVVEVGSVLGRGFEVDRISPQDTVLIFATGSGISPIRSLVELGFGAGERSDVRLYYGARNLQRMAYQDRFKDWESSGVRVIPVLSQPDERWKGERGYVQTAFSRAKQLLDSSSTAAVLCGQKQMTEDITSVLVAEGVPRDKILKNF